MALVRYTKEEMGRRVAAELEDGWIVNVGTGMPTVVLPFVPTDRDVMIHSENGIIGVGGEMTDPDRQDNDLMSAGARHVSLVAGGCFVDHATSFALVRGGRLDVTILGGYQVAENGDLANWRLPKAKAGNIGGAMDLVVGARRVFVTMTHVTNDGKPKIVKALTYPVTGRRCVTKIFTDLAVVSVTPEGLVLDEIAPGSSLDEVRAATGVELTLGRAFRSPAR